MQARGKGSGANPGLGVCAGVRFPSQGEAHRCSGQLALAANAKVFLRLHQRHSEQMGEQIQLMASGQSGQRWQALSNKDDGLLRTAIANQIIRSWPRFRLSGRRFTLRRGFFKQTHPN